MRVRIKDTDDEMFYLLMSSVFFMKRNGIYQVLNTRTRSHDALEFQCEVFDNGVSKLFWVPANALVVVRKAINRNLPAWF